MSDTIPFPQQPNAPIRPTIFLNFDEKKNATIARLIVNDVAYHVGKVALGRNKRTGAITRFMQIRGGHREYGYHEGDMIRTFLKAGYNIQDHRWKDKEGFVTVRYHYATATPKCEKAFFVRNNLPYIEFMISVGRKFFKVGWMTTAVEGQSERRADVLGLYIQAAPPTICYAEVYNHLNISGWPISIFS